ncbi:hypothetical protein ACFC1T_09340 [Kitasatospora sp. NPDC056076]|uniref:hypothetical protein n=1 Tax=Kitasatospora sp. NPDC056076 TaxID=3345703 RepID=UPI0035D63D58
MVLLITPGELHRALDGLLAGVHRANPDITIQTAYMWHRTHGPRGTALLLQRLVTMLDTQTPKRLRDKDDLPDLDRILPLAVTAAEAREDIAAVVEINEAAPPVPTLDEAAEVIERQAVERGRIRELLRLHHDDKPQRVITRGTELAADTTTAIALLGICATLVARAGVLDS